MIARTKIAVVGGGIAGCAVAIAARRLKAEVAVFDNASPDLGGGSVLLLWPNGMKAARALGVADEIRLNGTSVRRTEFKLWNDSRLWELDVGSFERRYGEEAVLISRESLMRVLRDALPTAVPIIRATCTGFAEFGRTVSPVLEAPPAAGVYDALVGCDGIRSAIRKQLRPADGARRSAYHSAWIGLSDLAEEEWRYDVGHTVTFLGHGLRLCASTMKERPGGARRVYWYATEAASELRVACRPPGPDDDEADLEARKGTKPGDCGEALTPRQLVDLFATVSTIAANLIQRSIGNPILKPARFHIQDRIPVRTWTRGRVCLAGDAAHPSTPDLGQGACQALESAAVLGRCLAETDDIEKAFRRFERLRLERTARVTEMSRLTAIQSMTRGPLVESIRELGIRTLLPTITEREFESLFSVEL